MPKLVTVDLETHYAVDYSLSKMPTEEYIRDDRFEVIGCAIGLGPNNVRWYPQPEVEAALRAIDWSDAMLVCQNTAFDGAILAWKYGIVPMAYADTLGMSRALYPHEMKHSLAAQAGRMGLGVKGDTVHRVVGMRYADFTSYELREYGEYCVNDVVLTRDLFGHYLGLGFPTKEMKLIDLTLRMYIEPVLQLDAALLHEHRNDVLATKEQLLTDLKQAFIESADPDALMAIFAPENGGIKKLLMSNEKFATLLRSFGVEPPTKISKTTGKVAYAFAKTDQEFLALREHPDLKVAALVDARLGNKSTIEESRTERFIAMASRGNFPVPLRYYGAHSGRWSGQDSINLQNLASRGKYKNRIKRAIKASPGYVVIDCDSSQIEARTLAWMAGQDDLVADFAAKRDVYRIMAAAIYSCTPEEVTPLQRQVGKTVVLGCGYGVGHVKLKDYLKVNAGVDVTLDEAKSIIDTYRSKYAKIKALWTRGENALHAIANRQSFEVDVNGLCCVAELGITLPSGLHIQYPHLRRETNEEGKANWVYTSKGQPVHIYGGKVIENLGQAVARCIVAEQMLKISKRYKVVLTVHDAVAIIAKREEADEARAFVEECMSWVPKWATGLPLACESGVGASYGDC